MSCGALAEARQAVDRALAARPRLDGDALTQATKALCRERDTLNRRRQDVGHVERLRTINGLISLLHGVHFPLGGAPWSLLQQVREGLDALEPAGAG